MSTVYPWQASQWKHLSERTSRGALPHALLLSGAPGLGKNEFARAWAKRMLCSKPDERGACGVCKLCQLLEAGTHPDLCVIGPEEGGRTIRVDQIRDMVGFVTSRARFDGYKVVILSPAEAMNVNAANALLKCLEEPGDDTLFLLVSDAPRQLLPTIRSRCQALAFPVPEVEEAAGWLMERGLERALALGSLAVAGGSPFRALAVADATAQVRRDDIFKAWSGACTGRVSVPVAAEVLAGGAASAAQAAQPGGVVDTLHWIALWWQEVARLKLDTSAPLAEAARRPPLLELAGAFDERSVFAAWDSTLALASAFQRGANFNVVLALEGWLLASGRQSPAVVL